MFNKDRTPLLPKGEEVFDVVVVGGGLSGLSTAFYLQKGAPNKFRSLVLEASDYLGGRTKNVNLTVPGVEEPVPVSIGGTWSILEAWATERLNKDVGAGHLLYKPKPKLVLSNVTEKLALCGFVLARLYYLGYKIVRDGKNGEWWNSARARKHDKVSLEDWLEKRIFVTVLGKEGIREYFNTIESFQDRVPMSATYAAVMIYERLNTTLCDLFKLKLPKTKRWHGGTGRFVEYVVNALHELGGQTRTSCFVRGVDQTGDFVKVTYVRGTPGEAHVGLEDGIHTVFARRVVVASSINAAYTTIQFTPPIGDEAVKLAKNVLASDFPSLNIVFVWETEWWKEPDGISMNILPDMLAESDEERLDIKRFGQVFNLTDTDAKHGTGELGIIRILSLPGAVPEGDFRRDEKIVERAKDFLCAWFPSKYHGKIRNEVLATKVFRWTDYSEQIPGVTYQFLPGAATAGSKYIRNKRGKIHFGGSERANGGLNWIEGAIQRGMEVWDELEEQGIFKHMVADQEEKKAKEEVDEGVAGSDVAGTALAMTAAAPATRARRSSSTAPPSCEAVKMSLQETLAACKGPKGSRAAPPRDLMEEDEEDGDGPVFEVAEFSITGELADHISEAAGDVGDAVSGTIAGLSEEVQRRVHKYFHLFEADKDLPSLSTLK